VGVITPGVYVAKADFKFNAAHFVAYEGFRERLHGHNYTVAVHFEAEGIQADGYVMDFGDIKAVTRRLCKKLNELFLCPAKSDVLEISVNHGQLNIACQDGAKFQFPVADAIMLPIKHTTVEELSHYFVRSSQAAHFIISAFHALILLSIRIAVNCIMLICSCTIK
jgi:6-pyruvoyltetrahydropterin/6-carboxytetrahydropterin synthase